MVFGVQLTVIAQSGLYFYTWNADDGLASNTFTVTQDKDEFIWVGTMDGIARFDSFNFEWIRAQDDDSLTIPSNPTPFLKVGPTGKIWAGTRGGLAVIDPVTLNVIARHVLDGVETVNNLHGDGDVIIVETDFALYAFNESGEVLQKRTFLSNEVPFLINDHRGFQKRADKSYLVELDWEKGFAITDSVEIKEAGLFSLGADKWQNDSTAFYLSESGELYKRNISLKDGTVRSIKIAEGLSETNIYRMTFEKDGSFWLGANPDLYYFQKTEADSYVHTLIEADPDSPYGRKVTAFNRMMIDSSQRLWMTSNDKGLSMMDTRQLTFKYFDVTKSGLGEFDRDMIWNVNEGDDGKIIVGGSHGAFLYEFNHPDALKRFKFLEADQKRVSHISKNKTAVNTLFHNGAYYYSLFFDGIYKVRPQSEPVKIFPEVTEGEFDQAMIRNMSHTVLNDSTILWARLGGLLIHNTNTDTFQDISITINGTDSYEFDVYNVKVKDAGIDRWTVYLSTSIGPMLYQFPDSTFQRFIPDSVKNDRVGSTNMVNEILGDEIWIGYLEKGIEAWNPGNMSMRLINEDNGLSNEGILGMIKDYKGRIWVSHGFGISCIFPETGKVENFYQVHGIRTGEYAQNAFSAFRNNYLAFGGHGAVFFHPDSALALKAYRPPLIFNRLQFNRVGENVPETTYLIPKDEIKVRYDDNNFEIGFTELNYSVPEEVSYSYRLLGQNEDWIVSSPKVRTAFFSNLEPGNYTLQVRTKRDKGEWEEPALNLGIEVVPPFWLTNWFLTVTFFVGFSMIGFVAMKVSGFWYRQRIKRLEMEQKAMNEREQLSRDLHDSIGSQLSLIARHLEQVRSVDEEESMVRLDAANQTARYTISQLRETLWALKNEEVHISRLAERLKELINRMLVGTGINLVTVFQINRDKKLQPIVILHLFRIVQEVTNNAIKYSEADEIELEITSKSTSSWSLRIKDNGVGFDINTLKREESYGLQHIEHRAEEIKAFAQLNSEPGEGTSVTITFNT